jgi:hypothetical protein
MVGLLSLRPLIILLASSIHGTPSSWYHLPHIIRRLSACCFDIE